MTVASPVNLNREPQMRVGTVKTFVTLIGLVDPSGLCKARLTFIITLLMEGGDDELGLKTTVQMRPFDSENLYANLAL